MLTASLILCKVYANIASHSDNIIVPTSMHESQNRKNEKYLDKSNRQSVFCGNTCDCRRLLLAAYDRD